MGGGNQIRAKLTRAWIDRTNMAIAACRRTHEELRHSLGIPESATYSETLRIARKRLPEIAEWVLIGATLLRAEGRLADSKKLIAEVEAFLRERAIPAPYWLHFQKGLTHFNEGEASAALDCFLAARALAENEIERIFSLCNALFCLENLGLPLEPHRREWEAMLAATDPDDATFEEARRLRDSLACREWVRQGDWEPAFAAPPRDPTCQVYYHQLWLSELAFHERFGSQPEEKKQAFFLAHPLSHQKAYRTRTVLGVVHEPDLTEFKITELADRIYLWTWRWLTNPDAFPVARVLAVLGAVDWNAIGPRLAAEDFVLIRNALGWMSLFDRAGTAALDRLVAKLRPPGSPSYLFFDWEYDWIRFWRARRDGAPEAGALFDRQRAHPLTARRELRIAALALPDRDAGPLRSLRDQLLGLADGMVEDSAPLIVDMSRQRLQRRRSAELLSANLCTAFELLHARSSVTLEEMALACFGIRRFDPLVHGPRISNLLTRMRRFSPPGLKFHIRSGQVHAVGSWQGVRILRPQPLVQSLRDEPAWKLWIRRDTPAAPAERNDRFVPPSTILRRIQPGTELRREDLERLTGKSRSTMNRLIAAWLAQGWLRKTGRARRTRYLLSSNPKELT